jgi:acyl carrier protein
MQPFEVMESIRNYITEHILDGKSIGLDATTPLLEWGVINSLEIVRLLSFFHSQFHVHIPVENMTADHFVNLATMTDLVLETMRQQLPERENTPLHLID